MELGTGRVKWITCIKDGIATKLGKLLLKYYNSSIAVNNLLKDGAVWSITENTEAEPFAEINLVITKAEVIYNTFDYSWVEKPAHVVEKLSAKADAEGNWRAESSVLDTLDTNEYTVQASSVDEAGNKYAEPQATTFYMPLEPITVAPTDHL